MCGLRGTSGEQNQNFKTRSVPKCKRLNANRCLTWANCRHTRRAGGSRKIRPVPHGLSVTPCNGRSGRHSRRGPQGKPIQPGKGLPSYEQLPNRGERSGVGHYRKFALAHHPASSERVLSANREKGKTYHAYWNRNRRSFQHFRQRVRNAEHSATPKIGLPMFANRRLLRVWAPESC